MPSELERANLYYSSAVKHVLIFFPTVEPQALCPVVGGFHWSSQVLHMMNRHYKDKHMSKLISIDKDETVHLIVLAFWHLFYQF